MTIAADSQQVPEIKSRIAPTPSGYLHQGNGFSFVLTWLLVREAGGKLLLRIDDADTQRARPEYIDDIFQCLDWLGLDWDSGPAGPDDFRENFSQENRFTAYQHLLELLRGAGVLYACSCSRSEIKNRYTEGIYQGFCRDRELPFTNAAHAWRIQVPREDVCFRELGVGRHCLSLAQTMGDFVVRRKGGWPAYQVASLADDLAWGTNLIVRGMDLLSSTAAQVYLAQCLEGQEGDTAIRQLALQFQQAQFLHHPLLLDSQGEKLSKSAGSTSLKSLREAGGTPLPVYARVAQHLNLPADAAASLNNMLQAFRESRRG